MDFGLGIRRFTKHFSIMPTYEELNSPELSKYLIEQLSKKWGLSIPVQKFA